VQKKAELIEILFGLRTWVGLRTCVLHGGPDPSWEGAVLRGWATHCKVQGTPSMQQRCGLLLNYFHHLLLLLHYHCHSDGCVTLR